MLGLAQRLVAVRKDEKQANRLITSANEKKQAISDIENDDVKVPGTTQRCLDNIFSLISTLIRQGLGTGSFVRGAIYSQRGS